MELISAYAGGGDTLVLQQATLKQQDATAFLGMIIPGRDETAKELARKLGAWFQNAFVPALQEQGTEDGLAGAHLPVPEGVGVTGILAAGEKLRLFADRESSTVIFQIRKMFGRLRLVSLRSDGAKMFAAEAGSMFLVTPGSWGQNPGEMPLIRSFGVDLPDEETAGRRIRELAESAEGSAIYLSFREERTQTGQ